MDGFRDRMNRGTSERGSYDRYDRSARRSAYGQAAAPAGISAEEVSQIVEENNEKQLDVIQDMFEDAKEDRLESEKQILTAIDDVIAAVADNKAEIDAVIEAVKEEKQDAKEDVYAAPVSQEPIVVDSPSTEEILRTVTSNSDLLAQFAEEQLPMLVRGNSSILNQIRENLDEKDELLREILEKASQPVTVSTPVQNDYSQPAQNNEEILSAAANNNALLNALRSEVAAVQSEIRKTSERLSANADAQNTTLDTEDAFTKAQADAMYNSLEESLHAECVKVYRNIHEVVENQNGNSADETKSALSGIKTFTIINLILLLLNFAGIAFIIYTLVIPEFF